MNDFKSAIEEGLKNVNRIEKILEEINNVFNLLNITLNKITPGVQIERETKEYAADWVKKVTGNYIPKYYAALVAKNNDNSIEIAKWEQATNGYPCYIRTDYDSINCQNKAALEKGLQTLLKDYSVAKIINSLIKVD